MDVSIVQAQYFILTLSRILAVIIYVPVLGGRSVPNPVKIGLGMVLAIILTPSISSSASLEPLGAIPFGFALAKEVLIGALAGFASSLTFGAISMAGHLMGVVSGFSAANILNPALEDNGTAMDQMFIITSILIFMVINGHHVFLLGVQRTFDVVPVNSTLPAFSLPVYLRMAADFINTGVHLALPVVGTLLLTDITLGLLARVAPQVHVFFLGIPLKIGVGLITLAYTILILAPNLRSIFSNLGENTLKLLGS